MQPLHWIVVASLTAVLYMYVVGLFGYYGEWPKKGSGENYGKKKRKK